MSTLPTIRYPIRWDSGAFVSLPALPTRVSRGVWFWRLPDGSTWIAGATDSDPIVRAERIMWHRRGTWPGPVRIRCHTEDRAHPWNQGRDVPGHHECSVCGCHAWIEAHGCAAGACEHCGHSG